MAEYLDHPRLAQTLLEQQGNIIRLTAELDDLRLKYDVARRTISTMHGAATGLHGLGPIRGFVEDVSDVRVRAEQAAAAFERVRERCQPVRDREGPGGMINASQILGLLSPTWPDGNYEAAALDEPGPAATEATELGKTARLFAALHQSAEQDVSRVIALYERWVKAGPPPLGTSLARWWDKRLVELHDALLPLPREQRERPTRPDGTPYRYHEIKAEGWGYCEGCRMWSTGTPDPHQCPGTYNHVAPTDQPKEK